MRLLYHLIFIQLDSIGKAQCHEIAQKHCGRGRKTTDWETSLNHAIKSMFKILQRRSGRPGIITPGSLLGKN